MGGGTEAARRPLTSHMSTHTTEQDEAAVDGEQERRYAELTIGDDEFVIYDRENHQAWIQSSVAVSITEKC